MWNLNFLRKFLSSNFCITQPNLLGCGKWIFIRNPTEGCFIDDHFDKRKNLEMTTVGKRTKSYPVKSESIVMVYVSHTNPHTITKEFFPGSFMKKRMLNEEQVKHDFVDEALNTKFVLSNVHLSCLVFSWIKCRRYNYEDDRNELPLASFNTFWA